jgi:hypothetical protein
MSVQWIENTSGITNCTWATCPSCGARYQGFHNCWTAPLLQQWPNVAYVYSQPWPLSDADVDRIARRVAELLAEREQA